MYEHLKDLRIGVVGATGLVGQEMLDVLAEHDVPAEHVQAFASASSHGKKLPYGSGMIRVVDIDGADFKALDVALLAVEGYVAAELAPRITAKGALVVDNSSYFRLDKDVPLVVPEVNAEAIGFAKKGIIANPNCSTIQMMVALAPLHRRFHALQVLATTFQSVSGAGRAGLAELERQKKRRGVEPEVFLAPIEGNVIPLVGDLRDDGYSAEEQKMQNESRKILDSKSLRVSATCMRVPVAWGHMVDVKVLFDRHIDMDGVYDALMMAEGLLIEDGIYNLTPVSLGQKSNYVAVGRLRLDSALTRGKGLSFVCTADNVRKGAALNAVQIVAKWKELGFGPM